MRVDDPVSTLEQRSRIHEPLRMCERVLREVIEEERELRLILDRALLVRLRDDDALFGVVQHRVLGDAVTLEPPARDDRRARSAAAMEADALALVDWVGHASQHSDL